MLSRITKQTNEKEAGRETKGKILKIRGQKTDFQNLKTCIIWK